MQRPRKDDPITEVVSSVTLTFPTIPVHGTPENWLSQSHLVTMNANHDDSCDDTTSSLGDSAYEFIDERSNASTDYEDQDHMTESTTSSDDHGFDQIEVQPQRATPSNRNNHPSEDLDSTISGSQDLSSESEHFSSNPPTQEHNTLERIMTDPHEQQESIQFDEPSIINLNSSRFTEVSHTLQVLEKSDRSHEYHGTSVDAFPGQLAVTVKQTMNTLCLTPESGSYKILYVGPSEYREPIVQKIGTALAASLKCSTPDSETSRPSKFNIVPISGFGEATSPEVVLIDSSGLELNVEECDYAAFTRRKRGNDTLHLRMTDGKIVHSSWTGSKFALSDDYKLPDIAIFCMPEHDSLESMQTRQFARSVMSRHGVQSIVITQTQQWYKHKKHITLDYLTPHICLQARLPSSNSAQIIKRSPIDLATFLSIDAGQMNRNLACLALTHGSSNTRTRSFGNTDSTYEAGSIMSLVSEFLDSFLSDSQRETLKSLERSEPMARFACSLIALWAITVIGLGLSGILGASKVSNSRIRPTPAIEVANLASHAPLGPGFASYPTSAAPATSAEVLSIRSLSPNTDIASFLLDAYTLAPNKSEQFKVHVLGDCHIVLRPPHWFSKLKKPPKLSFKVLRGETELDHQLTDLFDGVYALQIPREDAYGLLNVSIWTVPIPNINESFEVDFGSSWLKVAGWKKATRALTESIRSDITSLQTSLSTICDQTKTGLSALMKQGLERLKAQQGTEQATIQAHYKTTVRVKELFGAKTKTFTRAFNAKVHKRNAMISNIIKARAGQLAKDMSLYTQNKTSIFSKQTRVLARAATAVNVKDFARGAVNLKRGQLREAQKKALKTWWKLRGVPKKQSIKVVPESGDESHRRSISKGHECFVD